MGVMEDFLSGADTSKRESDNQKYLDSLQQRVERINALESDIEDLADEELEDKSMEFQQRLRGGEDINGKLLEEAFAVVREAAWYVHSSHFMLGCAMRTFHSTANQLSFNLGAFWN